MSGPENSGKEAADNGKEGNGKETLYFLDTNILMYAIGKEHPLKAPCIGILRAIEEEAIRVVSSTEVLQEILHRYRSLRRNDVAESAYRNLKTLCEAILPVTEPDLDRALEILGAAPSIQVRDAVHAGTMLNAGFDTILSADDHFDGIEGIRRVDPQVFSSR